MAELDPMEFYEQVTSGVDEYKEISLEIEDGGRLGGFELHIVDKKRLARTIERLPDSMFDAVEGAENADEAEDEFEERGGNLDAVTEDTVDAFEALISDSLRHPSFDGAQINVIVDKLSFEKLFELGTEVINMSVENTGEIRDFHERE